MDPHFGEFPDSIKDFDSFGFDVTALPGFDQPQNLVNEFKLKGDTLDLSLMDMPFLPPDADPANFVTLSSTSSEVESPDDRDFSETFLRYVNQVLMEENMEEKPSMFHDPLALQAAEKSLYETIGEKYPPSPNQPPLYYNQNIESPDDNLFGSSSSYTTNSSTSAGNSIDTQWIVDHADYKSSVTQSNPLDHSVQSTLQTNSPWSFGSINGLSNSVNSYWDSSGSNHLVSNMFTDSESILQFKRGMEEASKFLPTSNQLNIDLENYKLPPKSVEEAPEVVVKVEKTERDYSPNGSRGRKIHFREDSDFEEERSSKQSAIYDEEAELSEMFDRVLLCNDVKGDPACCDVDNELPSGASKNLQQSGQSHESNGHRSRAKNRSNKTEAVDLRSLLINCAQSVAADDHRTANEQLKQIRQHSSPTGDGTQRLAYIFANGLEARMAGTGYQIHAALASKRISAVNKLKAYQLYLSVCPFKKMAIFFANKMILKLAVSAPKRDIHIVDFGILYGFQWPMLIQYLSTLPGGPRKLRITGIELPQPGFRPTELVEETGRRLAKYCERFNVPFEYNVIAQKWETIQIGDLRLNRDEVLAVNCLFRFKNLLDETVLVDSPRDAVLKLIRQMNPDIFVHSVINGSYSAPFFVTRFREALFHYSAWFDMFDSSTISNEDQERMNLEKEFYGREVMNIIACEGSERVERPETYKQWQVRNSRAGFRLLPLNQELLKKLRGKVKEGGYHKDFVIDEDSNWMLQGWKGRILCASSSWIPA